MTTKTPSESPPNKTYELTEFEARTSPREEVERRSEKGLAEWGAALGKLAAVGLALDGRAVVKAGKYVGTARVGGLRVVVRPRIGMDRFARFLRYALGGDVETHGHADIGHEADDPIAELLCRVLADELSVLRQRGLSKRYVERRAGLESLRGRAELTASFPYNPKAPTPLVCRYHELTHDVPDNRLVLAGLSAACRLGTTTGTRRSLLDHRHAWASVASEVRCKPEDFERVRRSYTRLSGHYRLAHALCELLVLGRLPGDVFTGPHPSDPRVAGLCLDMGLLFEKAVARWVQEAAARLGLSVAEQAGDGGALLDGEGTRYATVRPDLVVFEGMRPVAVIDAKYKPGLGRLGADGKLAKVANADLYQLFFYAERLRARYGLTAPPRAYIVAPKDTGSTLPAPRYRTIRWATEGDAGGEAGQVCRLRFVDPDRLSGDDVSHRLQRWLETAPR